MENFHRQGYTDEKRPTPTDIIVDVSLKYFSECNFICECTHEEIEERQEQQ